MDPLDVVTRLCAHERRRGASDAERRAALEAAALLRATGGRAVRVHVQPRWVRLEGALVQAVLAALLVAASVTSVSDARVGLGLALLALVLLAGDVGGRARLLRRLTPARATQDVEARDRRADALVRVVLTAATDVPPASLLDSGALPRLGARLRARTRGRLPGPLGWLTLAGLGVAAAAGARLAGADGVLVGALQLVPTVGALLVGAALVDRRLARTPPVAASAASATAAVLELARRLRARPPRAIAVDVVLAGTMEPEGLGFAAWLRARRREGLDAEHVAVLALGPSGAGDPVWLAREGLVRARPPHPQLRALAEHLGPGHGARPVVARTASGARIARGRGWPGLALGALDADGAVPHRGTAEDVPARLDPAALERTVAFAEAVVRGLDDELAPLQPPPARPAPAPTSARAARRAAGA